MDKSYTDLPEARILIVDDTPENLKVLRRTLEAENHSILVATSGQTALKIALNTHPDLILLDVVMPGMDGFETCRQLKADLETQNIPVIFVTAQAETESIVDGFRVGGVDYIIKPFQDEEVLARVATHLKIDRLTRQLARKNAELSRANQQIQKASEHKSRFLASMAHELRTPMNAIIGFTRMVIRRAGEMLPVQQKENLDKVVQSANNLLDLINTLLDLSRIEAGRMDVNAEPFRVRNLVAACCDEIGPLVNPEVKLHCEVLEDVGEAHTDRGRMRQILMNLLSNTVKFTATGTIHVQAVREAGTLVISVADTGTGIPVEAQETIFEEFQQVKGSDPEHKGTGLGLPITKGFSELLGGRIDVESEVGQGSLFTVRVPVEYQETKNTGT